MYFNKVNQTSPMKCQIFVIFIACFYVVLYSSNPAQPKENPEGQMSEKKETSTVVHRLRDIIREVSKYFKRPFGVEDEGTVIDEDLELAKEYFDKIKKIYGINLNDSKEIQGLNSTKKMHLFYAIQEYLFKLELILFLVGKSIEVDTYGEYIILAKKIINGFAKNYNNLSTLKNVNNVFIQSIIEDVRADELNKFKGAINTINTLDWYDKNRVWMGEYLNVVVFFRSLQRLKKKQIKTEIDKKKEDARELLILRRPFSSKFFSTVPEILNKKLETQLIEFVSK